MTNFPLTQDKSCEAPAEDARKSKERAETAGVVQLSRAEAKQAWLSAGGNTEKAARQALRERLAKVRNGSTVWNRQIYMVAWFQALDVALYYNLASKYATQGRSRSQYKTI